MTDTSTIAVTEPDFYTFVNRLNEKLSDSGRDHAELAFGLGCSISIIPVGLVLVIAIVGGARSWISIALTLLGELLLAAVGATYFSYRAGQRAIARVYRDEVGPEIHQYLNVRQLTLEEFTRRTMEHFPESATLVQMLQADQSAAKESEPAEGEKHDQP